MVDEKVVILNLRKKILKKPRWKRAKTYMKRLREIIKRIVKSEKIKISGNVGKYIWRSSKFPKPKIKVKIKKEGEYYKVELVE
ncbi:MAG: hypothetical protein J7L39_00045 [Candidatus Aenigmarchaeota archaeon]|nr:hypothetical protein [Candidatus Aenigmarchaeota archaeon]